MNKAESHYQLGLDYYQGIKLPQDTDLAIDYLIKAAELNHIEAKILCANLLFKQAKNKHSIYYEDGYRLGTNYMIDLFRLGKTDVTLPYLLNNEHFNELCTLEELQEYYQEAYRLGYRETKFELAKLLYKNGSYHSAEQWFLDSVKEDISKEAHLYLYDIYCTKECYNEKKALIQFKNAMKYGFISNDYKEFVENDLTVLLEKSVYESGFSMDKVRNQVTTVSSHCYYAKEKFKKWLTEDKILVRIYFDLNIQLLNASYDYTHSDTDTEDFIYEPIELSEGYFSSESETYMLENDKEISLSKDSGFYQSSKRSDYIELEFRDIFDQFEIKDKNPHLNTKTNQKELDLLIQSDIRQDMKNKHKDQSKNLSIKVKKFNLYKSLVPSFDFKFTYNHEEFISERYAFNDPKWQNVFKSESEAYDYKAIELNIEFPLCKEVYTELEQIQKEVANFKKKVISPILLKIIALSFFVWSLIVFTQNMFFNKDLRASNYFSMSQIFSNIIWYIGGLITLIVLYFISRLKIYDPSITNLRQLIIEDPAFVLPQNANIKHLKTQYIEIIIFTLLAIILFASSGFLRII